MENSLLLSHVIKEAKIEFERECKNLPRLEIDRLWQRQLSEFISSTTGTRLQSRRDHHSAPISTRRTAIDDRRNLPDDTWRRNRCTDELVAGAAGVAVSSRVDRPLPEDKIPSQQQPCLISTAIELLTKEQPDKAPRKRKRSIDTLSTFDLLPPPYALEDVGNPAKVPRLVRYAVTVGNLDISQSSDFSTEYRVFEVEQSREEVPHILQRALDGFETAIKAGYDIQSPELRDAFAGFREADANTWRRKIRTLYYLCISVGALLYSRDFQNDMQVSRTVRNATEACGVLVSLRAHAKALQNKEVPHTDESTSDLETKLHELDAAISGLADSSVELQMWRDM